MLLGAAAAAEMEQQFRRRVAVLGQVEGALGGNDGLFCMGQAVGSHIAGALPWWRNCRMVQAFDSGLWVCGPIVPSQTTMPPQRPAFATAEFAGR